MRSGKDATPVEDADETRILELIRAGSRDAFDTLAASSRAGLVAYAASITRDAEAAQDVVQDVFAEIWYGRGSWHPRGTARAYLYRAVHNRALNAARRRKPMSPIPYESAASNESADDTLTYNRLLADYRVAIGRMPHQRRTVYRLCRLSGLTYSEAAGVLGVSENTIRTHMSEALRNLREALADYLVD